MFYQIGPKCCCLSSLQICLRSSSYLFQCLITLQMPYFSRQPGQRNPYVWSLLWGLTNAQCQKPSESFIIVCLAPLGTAKSLTCAMFLSERLVLWSCDPVSAEDSWSRLYALYPWELHSPKDVQTRLVILPQLSRAVWTDWTETCLITTKTGGDIDDLRDVVSSRVSLHTHTSFPKQQWKSISK